jgi:hypothetical protein
MKIWQIVIESMNKLAGKTMIPDKVWHMLASSEAMFFRLLWNGEP